MEFFMKYKRYLQWLNELLERESPDLVKVAMNAVEEAYEKNQDLLYKKLIQKEQTIHIFAFRGTSSFAHIKELAHLSTQKYKENSVYSGFLDHFNKIKSKLDSLIKDIKETTKDPFFVFAGHSLGATSAALAFLYNSTPTEKRKLFLFGMPKMGDLSFYKNLFNTKNVKEDTKNNIHFVELTHNNHSDPVTIVPILMKNIISTKELNTKFKDFINYLHTDEDSPFHFKLHTYDNYKKSVNSFLQQKEKARI